MREPIEQKKSGLEALMDKALDEGYRYFSFQCCDDGEIICEVSKVGQEDWTCEDGPTPLSALTKTLKEASLNHE